MEKISIKNNAPGTWMIFNKFNYPVLTPTTTYTIEIYSDLVSFLIDDFIIFIIYLFFVFVFILTKVINVYVKYY